MQIEVRGDIIPNDDKWIYQWLEWESTCPNDVKSLLAAAGDEEPIEVLINSGGGSVMAGQEIYSILRAAKNVTISIQSLAGSAASVIAMAGRSRISPVGMLMVHNVSMSGASGDYHDMQKNAEILRQMNAALAEAFVTKTGKSQDEILRLMDRETWLTANQCVDQGFVDEIISESPTFSNAVWGTRLTDEIRQRVLAEKAAADAERQSLLQDLDMYGV